MQKASFLLVFLLLIFKTQAQNTDSAWFVQNYTKKEVYIPMRDGVKLFTSFYIPKDEASQHPFLLTRTPYSCAPYGEDKYAPIWNSYKMEYARANYIFVTQDVRGRYMSEGVFVDVRPFILNKKRKSDIDESTDTYDAIDWMVKNITSNNGRVGVMGTSYPGFYSTEAALCGHPALKAVSPQAPVTDWFMGDDFHHNGAFFMMDAFSFYPYFGQPHPKPKMEYGKGFSTPIKDNYKFYLQAATLKNLSAMIGDSILFWHEVMQHPNYDLWWQARNARTGLYNVKPAMLWVGGLFDAEDCFGAWNCYKATKKQSPQTNNKIVMGPWYHGQWSREGSYLGNVRFGSNTSDWYQQNIEIPFFQYYLLDKGSVSNLAEANIFFTGENKWKTFTQWPPANVEYKDLIITQDGKLSFEKDRRPARLMGRNGGGLGISEYTSDPAHPVPYTDGVHEHRTREYMTDDQRFASRRPDVLTFSSDVLSGEVTLAGPVTAALVTSISTTDADFVVKIIDEFPDTFAYDFNMKGNHQNYPMGGYQMLVRGEIMRGKFRKSFEHPEAFTPNAITPVNFTMPDIAHTFKKGHRIVIQIQSTWFPLVDRNPQQFLDIYEANENDFKKADIKIFHTATNQTHFILPVISQ